MFFWVSVYCEVKFFTEKFLSQLSVENGCVVEVQIGNEMAYCVLQRLGVAYYGNFILLYLGQLRQKRTAFVVNVCTNCVLVETVAFAVVKFVHYVCRTFLLQGKPYGQAVSFVKKMCAVAVFVGFFRTVQNDFVAENKFGVFLCQTCHKMFDFVYKFFFGKNLFGNVHRQSAWLVVCFGVGNTLLQFVRCCLLHFVEIRTAKTAFHAYTTFVVHTHGVFNLIVYTQRRNRACRNVDASSRCSGYCFFNFHLPFPLLNIHFGHSYVRSAHAHV